MKSKEYRINREMMHLGDQEMYLSPEQVMTQAFQEYQLLVLIGDPGSGKTTLLQYYAINCLEGKHRDLGFREKEILPLYFPLRELKFTNDIPQSLQDNLASWSGLMHQKISAGEFQTWLEGNNALVLLDGLDEISDCDKRKQVCQWVKHALVNFERAHFVLTSRPTGMRKLEGIELECDYQRADILDFSLEQQERFLKQWFNTLYLKKLSPAAAEEQKINMEKKAADRVQKIIDYLNREDNKSIRQLARSPIMLQIMAILWEDRDYLPRGRCQLYDISLNYLLEFRDDKKGLKKHLLPAEDVRSVLAPSALSMLESKNEYILKRELHDQVQVLLRKMEKSPDARHLCENLRDRSGLIADYGTDHYIFRHKSFVEFLAAVQLLEECKENHDHMQRLVESFKSEGWEEPLRFFIGKSNINLFDRFMHYFFQSEVSRDLDSNKQTLLENLVREAPFREIKGMVQYLDPGKVNDRQIRYILNCLKIIDTPESIGAVVDFLKGKKGDGANLDLAGQIAAEMGPKHGLKIVGTIQAEQKPGTMTSNYLNSFEDNAVYIKIPGGTYAFSVTGKMETVPDLYFCKYMLTNKRYRKFIAYLEGKEKPLEEILPLQEFSGKLLELSGTVKEYKDNIGQNPLEWGDKFRSRLEDDKKFNGDDQPVVGITWYGAHAYCFWLSCLHKQKMVYRLPSEVEWEWAAGGKERREYPWPKDKGEPTPKLANYGENVGATTPVGRYPEGATPEGLMDMAGNAWEWMANWYDKDEEYRALRGGSWGNHSVNLRCAARVLVNPWS
ncbi:MAG: SUMF1/EgtB/PvdO family nonheme iron enzyme, partial [Acidobacteria bacterium]|nr:SUMF1/EgtB/PvdO family nonheme iron enzyme [Acidobacteriota bacterium]